MIREAIDDRTLVALKGNTRPEASPDHDLGAVPDNFPLPHLLLQLRRSPEQEQALRNFIDRLHTPGSPNFHRWLSAQDFGSKYGLASADLGAINGWLRSHGFTVNTVYSNGTLIDFGGTAAQVRAAFHTEIHRLDAGGTAHFANMSDPRIPAALLPAVMGVIGLHDFSPHPMRKTRTNYTFGASEYAVVPGDLATIYNLNPLFNSGYAGQGQTVVVVEDTDVFSTADWTTYRSTFGLSNYTSGAFTTVHPAPPSGRNNCSDPGVNGDESEAILDAELAAAAAPGATIELASCGSSSGLFIAVQNLIDSATPPAIMSISYGECEATLGAASNAAVSAAYQQAVSEGVSVFVSAGDQAAAGCDVNTTAATHGIAVSGLASTPYNVAVGGTDFGDVAAGIATLYWNSSNSATYGSAVSYVPEIPWNDSCAGALLWSYFNYPAAYGTGGFCNSPTAASNGLLNNVGGSGGPSGCATGVPSISGVVSGSCAGTPKPSWQSGVVGIPNDGVRDMPDISLFAANGLWGHYYVFCWSDTANGGAPCTGSPSTWSGAGGTSFSSPIMAGIQALINQKAGGRQGNPNYVYYPLAAKEYGVSGSASCNSNNGYAVGSSCIFYDVTQGDMDVNCTGAHNCYAPSGTQGVLSTSNSSPAIAFGTTVGWDFATGIGTVNAFNLATNWPSSLPTSMVTIQTSPPGLQFSVDGGTAAIAPQTLTLSQTSHTIAVAVTQAGAAGTQFVFTSWSDGGQASHSIVVASGTATYTATFQTQYQLTITASPLAGGTITPVSGMFYAAGTMVPISATPAAGYRFVSFSGDVTSTANPLSIAVGKALNVQANFAARPAYAGIFRQGFLWVLDIDGNRQMNIPPDSVYAFGGIPGDIPITGDWNGDGNTKIGIYRPGNGLFILDTNGNGVLDAGDAVF
ncbi:MAG TPA: protease pro-enzyme activation domain-containing protein, partial [Bryobacteraceae bacterium]|nr:protease pro-enzyme activation domain-containing protein [Bryobacteraceae bacterium]